PALREWLSAHQQAGEPVYVSYFGSDEPARFVPDPTLMPRLPTFDRPRPWYWCEPGIYAVSATMLQHVYAPEKARWSSTHELRYQQLRLNDAAFRAVNADPARQPAAFADVSMEEWSNAWTVYESLRFARLCQYLRARRPDGMAGYSILIYRLTREEIAGTLEGDVAALAKAIARAQDAPP
ncbi:MAG: hypothetical protein QG602_1859, partial [Verrucomicrobiota bacterium]|nr:hypothetical protein [Verrucomicrobiota bacterium]